jgi:hypothetical protein
MQISLNFNLPDTEEIVGLVTIRRRPETGELLVIQHNVAEEQSDIQGIGNKHFIALLRTLADRIEAVESERDHEESILKELDFPVEE